ncbi:cupin domain-containing protein [Chryseobacterium sp.]|uniref:cupin domain-containing protein n=1 Tax=Chryseobacterium sp. TaxID=1871047 RepID=UPI0035AFB96F
MENINSSIFPVGNKVDNKNFVGNAYLQVLTERDKNNDYVIGSVTFDPGARNNWHSHPKGQVLLVTEGEGIYQERGKPARRIKKGNIVKIPENTEHWHGATMENKLVHIAVTSYEGDSNSSWFEPVNENDYKQANEL